MKENIRKAALAARNAMPAVERAEKSACITKHILKSDAYKKADCIFSFVSMGSEVETRDILKQAWADGKAVAVPKTGKEREMFFLEIASLEKLQEGRFGVMEPVGTAEKEVIPKENDLFLVPGAAFDKKKNRLGYGGGYYDTYFAKHQGYRKIGLAFSAQLWENDLPVEKTDIPLDDIVMENGWEE